MSATHPSPLSHLQTLAAEIGATRQLPVIQELMFCFYLFSFSEIGYTLLIMT